MDNQNMSNISIKETKLQDGMIVATLESTDFAQMPLVYLGFPGGASGNEPASQCRKY